MKKFRNVFLAFAAISALSLAFVSCGGDDDDDDDKVAATESTVKGTYTMSSGDSSVNKNCTLVFVDGKIYQKTDALAVDESEDESEDGTPTGSVTYNLAYVGEDTTHTPSATFAEITDEESDFAKTITEKAAAGETSYIIYVEVGTYTISDGNVTGTILDGDDEYQATATTDSATGHLKTFTVTYSSEPTREITPVIYDVESDGAGDMTSTAGTDNADLTIYTSSAGDIIVKTASGSKPKLDSSKYVQFNTSSTAEFDALVITVSAACKATFTVNAASNDTSKVYSLNGTPLTKETSYYTQVVSLEAGDNTIKGSGFKFSKIAFE